MKISLLLASTLLLLFPSAQAHEDGTDHDNPHDDENVVWNTLETTLPKALSDLTATLRTPTAKVYIAGGCDSSLGNEYLSDEGFFVCNSVSDALYEFDIDSQSFTTLAALPRPRYRHAAAIVNDQLWLIGGRSLDDTLIAQVDVYDITSNTWSTVGSLPALYQTSDHGGFAVDNYIYILGGFDVEYVSLDQVYRIDTSASPSSSDGSLAIETRAHMTQPRGDVTAVYDGYKYAYIAGGFSHTNDFCQPLGSAEQYDVHQNAWTTIAPLQTPRAEKVLVRMDSLVFAVGGETHIENFCISENNHDVGEQTVAVDTVEVYEDGAWNIVWSLPKHKFRFAAVAWEPSSAIYTFGGQTAFNNDCQCFQTTDDIVMYLDESEGGAQTTVTSDAETSSALGSTNAASVGVAVGGLVFMTTVLFL